MLTRWERLVIPMWPIVRVGTLQKAAPISSIGKTVRRTMRMGIAPIIGTIPIVMGLIVTALAWRWVMVMVTGMAVERDVVTVIDKGIAIAADNQRQT